MDGVVYIEAVKHERIRLFSSHVLYFVFMYV
jgi:hypothetical protein